MAKRIPKKPGNDYDKIFKENLEPLILPLLRQYFGLEIAHKRRLPDKIQTTTERETDFLFEISDAAGEKTLLHIEFQNWKTGHSKASRCWISEDCLMRNLLKLARAMKPFWPYSGGAPTRDLLLPQAGGIK